VISENINTHSIDFRQVTVGRGGEREEKAQKPKYFIFQVKVIIPENFRARGFTQKAFYGEVSCFLEQHNK